jgi:hypothetical protein
MGTPDDSDETVEMEESDRYLSALIDAEQAGEDAARVVSDGGAPDVDALERHAWAIEELRVGIEAGRLGAGWVRPTEPDVEAARELARRAREGAPSEDLRALGLRVYRVTADPQALYNMCTVLAVLAEDVPRRDRYLDPVLLLDDAMAFCERGGEVAGFSPTPEDAAAMRRLREIAFEPAAADERKGIVASLRAKMPRDQIAEGAAQQAWYGLPRDTGPS